MPQSRRRLSNRSEDLPLGMVVLITVVMVAALSMVAPLPTLRFVCCWVAKKSSSSSSNSTSSTLNLNPKPWYTHWLVDGWRLMVRNPMGLVFGRTLAPGTNSTVVFTPHKQHRTTFLDFGVWNISKLIGSSPRSDRAWSDAEQIPWLTSFKHWISEVQPRPKKISSKDPFFGSSLERRFFWGGWWFLFHPFFHYTPTNIAG